MKKIRLITVGRLRTSHWQEAASAYTDRLQRTSPVEEAIVKDGDASLAIPDRIHTEGKRILAVLKPGEYIICLDEHGKSMDSKTFAYMLQRQCDAGQSLCFIVGGAYGLAKEVLQKASLMLSFGPMTFPHELARVLLFEQLYRADNILRNTPYHHE